MNPFTEHTQAQGLSYSEHWYFAMGVAWRLLNSVFAFTLHAIFPFIHIDRRLDFEATMDFINERNDWLANIKKNRWFNEYSKTLHDQMQHKNQGYTQY